MNLDEIFDARYLRFQGHLLARAPADMDDILRLSGAGPGATFVDIGCGEGRLAREAARRGLSASGVDASPTMTVQARTRAAQEGLKVSIFDWDMRQGPAPGRWDVAASWFTSFGFFDDEQCRQVLQNIRDSLNTPGVFVMDLVNKDYLLPRLKDTIVVEQEDGVMIDRLHYDEHTGRLHTRRLYFDAGGFRAEPVEFYVRLLAYPELADWLGRAGFVQIERDTKESGTSGRLRIRARVR